MVASVVQAKARIAMVLNWRDTLKHTGMARWSKWMIVRVFQTKRRIAMRLNRRNALKHTGMARWIELVVVCVIHFEQGIAIRLNWWNALKNATVVCWLKLMVAVVVESKRWVAMSLNWLQDSIHCSKETGHRIVAMRTKGRIHGIVAKRNLQRLVRVVFRAFMIEIFCEKRIGARDFKGLRS